MDEEQYIDPETKAQELVNKCRELEKKYSDFNSDEVLEWMLKNHHQYPETAYKIKKIREQRDSLEERFTKVAKGENG